MIKYIKGCVAWLFEGMPKQAMVVGALLFSMCFVLAVWVWSVNSDTRDIARDNQKLAHVNHQLGLQGRDARLALCSFQVDLKDRINKAADDVKKTKFVLKKNPDGVLGFTRSDILLSIKTQKRTLENLIRTYNSVAPYIHCARKERQ